MLRVEMTEALHFTLVGDATLPLIFPTLVPRLAHPNILEVKVKERDVRLLVRRGAQVEVQE
jgi:hypothetical protein